MISATASMMAKVSRYWMSLTAKVSCGGTKKKSKVADRERPRSRPPGRGRSAPRPAPPRAGRPWRCSPARRPGVIQWPSAVHSAIAAAPHGVARPARLAGSSHVEVGPAAGEERVAQRRLLVGAADHVQVDALGAGEQLAVGRRPEQAPPQRAARPADDDARDVALARVVGERLARRCGRRASPPRRRATRRGAAARCARCASPPTGAAGPASRRRPRSTRRAARSPCACRRAPGARPARRGRSRPAARSPAAQVARMPWPARYSRIARSTRSAVRAQRELAQRDQVALAEEVLDRVARLLGHVDLAVAQPLEQLVGRQCRSAPPRRRCSNTASGTVSCMRTPVMPATTSFRLSTCWTLTVV